MNLWDQFYLLDLLDLIPLVVLVIQVLVGDADNSKPSHVVQCVVAVTVVLSCVLLDHSGPCDPTH